MNASTFKNMPISSTTKDTASAQLAVKLRVEQSYKVGGKMKKNTTAATQQKAAMTTLGDRMERVKPFFLAKSA